MVLLVFFFAGCCRFVILNKIYLSRVVNTHRLSVSFNIWCLSSYRCCGGHYCRLQHRRPVRPMPLNWKNAANIKTIIVAKWIYKSSWPHSLSTSLSLCCHLYSVRPGPEFVRKCVLASGGARAAWKKNVEKRRKNVVKGFSNVLIRFKRPSKGIKRESGRVKCTPVRLQYEVNSALACWWRSAKKSGGNIPKVW